MRIIQSLKNKLIIGFIAIMLPLVVFMMINNLYAKEVVREKVSQTYRNTLDIFVKQTDSYMKEINSYLYKMAVLDSDVGILTSYPYGSDTYVLTKVRINNKINRDVGFYSIIDTIFLYHENDEIIGTVSDYGKMQKVVQDNVKDVIKAGAVSGDELSGWILWYDERVQGGYFLVTTFRVTEGFYVGAIIKLSDIVVPLGYQWADGDIGESSLYRSAGTKLLQPLSTKEPAIALTDFDLSNEAYQTVKDKVSDESYLIMSQNSTMAPMTYVVTIPEKTLLKSLLFFQKATYFVPLGFLILLMGYLFFMRGIMFKPLAEIIIGMKKISLGMLGIRLQSQGSVEFNFLANTFNQMAGQIETLKIGVYEEQLRVQKSEMKQLQAQINPHFYMNSLNIIYNFAALKDTESVKKMSLHLADYFRFIMTANRDTISLGEEINHIRNYIDIQKLRFPDKLDVEIDIPDEAFSLLIPALTIQPVVENSILHGFKNRRQIFRISIEGVQTEEGTLIIKVSDNGIGFVQEVLEDLQSNRPLSEAQSSRLGIVNVIHRLKLRYGDKAEIEFDNQANGSGAIVTFRFFHWSEMVNVKAGAEGEEGKQDV
ncbi:hypothetical protein Back11_60500 [Paenibacillus baekrokdamisoli]|uniref:Uncharacterized protein n=1 Tax=Paenibacillus baekrokdamisoli TaxID=1712516 RepID=A0A3G9J8M7_9BACL|nr:histidine kinase [Paenibacillus baekrokdamisoli]MBB3072121.1 two-component system sensor histidine kinase YesM [Paenibacillus baekrokdamisoli]BBH24705.1 hypothetical protein Back11_60500 [Paenibacillus baekrokdamisoli]